MIWVWFLTDSTDMVFKPHDMGVVYKSGCGKLMALCHYFQLEASPPHTLESFVQFS